jgi:glycosyltransferase involved in cell wall biosynthesis
MNLPILSIIIPVYNRADIIIDTLMSVKNQSFSEWECLVIDDFSTDNTSEFVTDFVKNDHRFHYYLNQRKKGAQGARNTGVINAKGYFVSFFDSDNLMLPERLSKQMRLLLLNNISEIDCCTCFSKILDDNGNIVGDFSWISRGNILKGILAGSTYVDFNNLICKKSFIEKIGMLDEDCPSFQEWDTGIRLAMVSKFETVPEQLVLYYQRSSGRISNDMKRELQGLSYLYSKHKNLWISEVGVKIYYYNIFSLKQRILKNFKNEYCEFLNRLPDLNAIPPKLLVQFKLLKFKTSALNFLFKIWLIPKKLLKVKPCFSIRTLAGLFHK